MSSFVSIISSYYNSTILGVVTFTLRFLWGVTTLELYEPQWQLPLIFTPEIAFFKIFVNFYDFCSWFVIVRLGIKINTLS